MSKSQRTKGASYEREVCNELALWINSLDVKPKRNIGQARDGGCDIELFRYNIECKRRKTLGTIYGWMEQCIKSCDPYRTPVVIARQDAGESIVIMRLKDWCALVDCQ